MEEPAEYIVQTRSDVKEMLDDANTAVNEVSRLPSSIHGKGCIVGACGLRLVDGIKYTQFQSLIRYMDNLAYGHSVRECLFKFYIGDAFNGGESLFGEKYSQVMDRLHWKQSYISNIQWVCRNVPQENRNIKVTNWKFWTIVAPLAPEDQRYWVSEALEAIGTSPEWFSELKARMSAWQIANEVESIQDEELRAKAKDVAEANDNVSWCNVRDWKRTGRVPKKNKTSAQWWTDELDEAGIDGQVREVIFDMAMRFTTEVKNRRINPEGKRKLWSA